MGPRTPLLMLVVVTAISACKAPSSGPPTLDQKQPASVSGASSNGIAWESYISIKNSRSRTKGASSITLSKATSLCREILANGGSLRPIVQREGLLMLGWKHTGQPNGYWSVSQNEFDIDRLLVFYDRLGKVRNVTFFTSPGFAGGLQYWMEPDEACKPGVLHSDRARIGPTKSQAYPFSPPSSH